MSQDHSKPQFSKLRTIFFPVYLYELKKVLPMGIIFFCILAIYTLTRNIKDAQIVTAPGSGAEALSYLKLWFVMPSSIVFLLLYTKGSNVLSRENLFYATIAPFIVFFGLFGFLIYPNREVLHMAKDTIESLKVSYPGLKWFFPVLGNWTFSIFYIASELWGSAILSLSFWQFANQITRIPEAKRFYAFFGLMGQVSSLAVGYLGGYFSKLGKLNSANSWGVSLYYLMGMVVIMGIVCVYTYGWMYRNVLTDKRFYDPEEMSPKKKKKKPSLKESFRIIFTSPYLGLIAMLVIAYGITVNCAEGVWKDQLKQRFPDPNDFNTFTSQYTVYIGWATMIMLVVGGNFLRIFRWTTCAIITPVIMLVMGALFFAFILFRQDLAVMIADFGTTPLIIAVWLGVIMLVATKSTKYALFDLTKEMAYIPLDDDMKVKGKATVDVVGGRLGKSGGAFIQFGLFTLFGSIGSAASYATIAPYLAGAFLLICLLWILSVKALGKRVEAATKAMNEGKTA